MRRWLRQNAILFTLIEARRSRSIAPWEYLREVLTQLPTMTPSQIEEVTPEAWAKRKTTPAPPPQVKQ